MWLPVVAPPIVAPFVKNLPSYFKDSKLNTDPIPDYFVGQYIDDCPGTASCSRAKLERFFNLVNYFHQVSIKTWEISEIS